MATNDISAVASLEITDFENLTNLQRNMYLSEALDNSITNRTPYVSENDNEVIGSKFYIKPKKTTMYSDIIEKMTSSPGAVDEYNYIINDKMDFINYIYMTKKIPGIKVKDTFKDNVQISWTHNLGHNIIESFELLIDSDPKQTITNTWLDICSQFFINNDHRKNYRKNIGDEKYSSSWTNVKNNGTKGKVWGTELFPFTVKVPLPFSFDVAKTPFPIFLSNQSKVLIKGKFKSKFSQLLKMRIRDGNEWQERPFDWRVLEGIQNEYYAMIDPPELYTCYSKITKEEKNYWYDSFQNDKKSNVESPKKTYKYYYNDIIINSYDKLYTSSEPFNDTLSSKSPTKGIFWVAQNNKGLDYNNYSNYTTNPFDISMGKDPIEKVGIKHTGTASRCKDMESYHFVDMVSYYRLPSSPYAKGYGAMPFSKNMLTIDADIGPIFDQIKTSLSLVLGDGVETGKKLKDIKDDALLKSILEKSDDEDKSNNKYKIFIFTVIMKQFQFSIADKIKVNDGT